MKERLFISVKFLVKVAIATILPLAVFGVLGKAADGLLDTGLSFFIVGCIFALFTTVLLLRFLSKKIFKKMDELG